MTGGVDSKWFKNSWAFLVLFAMAVHYINKKDEPLWGSAERWQLLDDILTYMALAGTLALFVWSNICNWRISPRLFWRKWDRWSTNIAVGILSAVVFVLIMMWLKPHSVLDHKTALICFAVVVGVALVIKLVAKTMYKLSVEKPIKQ